MRVLVKCLLAGAVAAMAVSSPAFVYQYDDGTAESGLSTSGPATFNVAYLMGYTVVAGATTVTSVDLIWGVPTSPNLPNGLSADVLLMSDPNGDGNPNDAAIIESVTTTTVNVGSSTFNSYAINATNFNVGDKFFVGAFIRDVPTGSSWVAMDTNAIGAADFGWWNVVVSSPVGSYIPLDVFGPDLSFMVRANAVPEPATMLVLGAGLALVARRRLRKS